MSTQDSDEQIVRPFSDWLREQAKGHSHEELSESLHELIHRVQDTGKKGSLQYTVVVEPLKDADAFMVKDEIKLKLPEHDRETSLFYVDRDGNLSRNDPNQLAFEGMRALPDPEPAVDIATGEIRKDTSNS